MSDHKDMTHRHLKHKLQSLSRRLDELEEATNKLQKSEDELLDLQVSADIFFLSFLCAFKRQCVRRGGTEKQSIKILINSLLCRTKSSRQRAATHHCLVMWRL